MSFYKFSTALCVSLLTAPAAMASTILIDDFSAGGSVASNFGGNPDTTDVGDADILGDERFMWVSSDDAPNPGFGTTFSASAGNLDFVNGSTGSSTTPFTGTGQAVLVYDGALNDGSETTETFTFNDVPQPPVVSGTDFPTPTSAAISVDTDGLGGIDFLAGLDPTKRGIEFEFASFDPGGELDFRAYIWDTDGNIATYQELLTNTTGSPTDVDFNTVLGLDELTFGPDFDWENVGAVAFSVESITTEFAGTLTSISVVPLPFSALLLLGGLGGLAGASAVSKRRRKA